MNVKSTFATVLFFLVPFIVPLPSHAQWNIGGVLNLNLSSFNVDPKPSSEEYSSRLGLGLGVVLDRPLTDKIDLHAEPMFLQKGGKIEEAGDKITLKISYFELPFLFRYHFEIGASIPVYVMAGPSLGFRINAETVVKNGPTFDSKDEVKGLDLGLGFGGGVRKPQGNKTFFAEARYILGLANINEDSDGSKVTHNGLQVAVGFTVPLPR